MIVDVDHVQVRRSLGEFEGGARQRDLEGTTAGEWRRCEYALVCVADATCRVRLLQHGEGEFALALIADEAFCG